MFEKSAETLKKEAVISAKEEILRQRNEAERELKERRSEVSRQERRITQKEEALDKKSEAMERKSEQLDRKMKECDDVREKVSEVLKQHLEKLEKISGYTAAEAKDELISRVEIDARHEMAQRLAELEEQFKDEADTKAKNILSLAIQRYAADHVSEATISVVQIPSEDMKGRIIGREGRNIQKLETLTGVELIIDDTPEAITLSGSPEAYQNTGGTENHYSYHNKKIAPDGLSYIPQITACMWQKSSRSFPSYSSQQSADDEYHKYTVFCIR